MENLVSPLSDSIRNYIVPSNVDYFYGRLLREDAVQILKKRSETLELNDGLFLLRESMDEIGNYVLSIFHDDDVTHYKIVREDDCRVVLLNRGSKSKPFIGPVELIEHLKKAHDDLLIDQMPRIPCSRPREIQPISYLFLNKSDLDKMVNEEIESSLQHTYMSYSHMYNNQVFEAKTVRRYIHEKSVLKNIQSLNRLAPTWFKENCSDIEAYKILKKHKDSSGAFLVRTYAKKRDWSKKQN